MSDADAVAKRIIAETDIAAVMTIRCLCDGAWLDGPFAWTWFAEAAWRLEQRSSS